jgi:uridylate kinase
LNYKRVILKLSGESLSGNKSSGIDYETLYEMAKVIKVCSEKSQIGIVIGGGNFWRGRQPGSSFMNSDIKSDRVGMLATLMNSIVFSDVLENFGIKTKIQTSISVPQIAQTYSVESALNYLEDGYIVIFACGIGMPFFSTDTAAALRASELQLKSFSQKKLVPVFKATNTDGVYDSDPKKNINAKKYEKITFDEILAKNLKVIDATAASICRENKVPILVFSIKKLENLILAFDDKNIGTWILPSN